MSTPTESIDSIVSEVEKTVRHLAGLCDMLRSVHANHVQRTATHDYAAMPHATPCVDEPPYRED